MKKGRKSVNKALDKVANVDPASIALPESPINVWVLLHQLSTFTLTPLIYRNQLPHPCLDPR